MKAIVSYIIGMMTGASLGVFFMCLVRVSSFADGEIQRDDHQKNNHAK